MIFSWSMMLLLVIVLKIHEVSVVIIWITETIMTTKLKIIIIFSLLSSIFLVILMLKYHKQQLSVLKFRTSKTVYVPK